MEKNMRVVIFPYAMASESGKDLAEATQAMRVFPDRKYHPKHTDLVIGWGASEAPRWDRANLVYLNRPENVKTAVNKLQTFRKLKEAGIPTPPWTDSKEEAELWAEKARVFCRTKLEGHSGEGIVVAGNSSEIVPARLYTKYIPKSEEYRIHVFDGRVIDCQQKRKKRDAQPGLIRSVQNGYVFCRANLKLPEGIQELAIRAVSALNLDFGAVDIIVAKRSQELLVLEVNTAPGLEGSTLGAYALAIRRMADDRKVGDA